jgi:hypothetical protein
MNTYQNHPLAGAVDLDSAMAKLWAFYKKYFVGLYIISVVLGLLSSLITSGLDLAALQTTTDPAEMLEMMKGMAGPYTLLLLVSFVSGIVLHAWVLEKPLGEPDFIATVLKKSLVALIPCLAVMIVFFIITMVLTTIGLILLVLPGLFALFYMFTVMIFVMPVILTESRNPVTVVTRSFRLAHSHLWPNMGWAVVVLLIIIVASLVIASVTMLPFTGSFIRSLTNPEEASAMLEISRNPLYIAISSLATALVTPVLPIIAFILYFRNRGDEMTAEITTEGEHAVRVEDLYPPMPDRE